MHIKQFFPDFQRPRPAKKEETFSSDGEREPILEAPKTPVLVGQRASAIKRMPSFILSLKRHSSTPNMKSGSRKKLPSVSEAEEIAFNHQIALLEEPPEWDLDDAGVGAKNYETPSLTPPAITASRATSPSRREKIAETSKKQFEKFTSKIKISSKDSIAEEDDYDDERLSRSLPDLSKLSGKGHAGSPSDLSPELRGRSRSVDGDGPRHRRSKSGPPSWRMPPNHVVKRMPHVREAIPPPSFQLGEVQVMHHESSVMARAMWKNGEVRYEDQWGHRLVPIGRHNSFMFELWPVSEMTEEESPVSGKAKSSEE